MKKKQAIKNVSVIKQIVEEAATEGKTCNSLERIVENIVALNAQRENPTEAEERA